MRFSTPEHVKSAVIDAWLMGKTRDNIASEFNVSTGTVSNIIEQWQNRIGVYDAHNLRELGLGLKKARITPGKCVDGLRIINIINQLGIDEDHLFDFVNKLYSGSIKERLEPSDTVRLVKAINALPDIISLNDIPHYINKKWQEKIKLDEDINYKKRESEKLDQEIERKRKEIQDLKDDSESFRNEMENEKKDFLLFRDAKDVLNKNGIDIHLLEPLMHVIKIFQEMYFRPLTIFSEFSDINAYKDLVKNKERKIKDLELHIQQLKTIIDNYETKIASNETIVLSLTNMENLGFKASDIKNIGGTFSNISKKYGLKKEEIKIRFFRYMNRLDTLLSLEQDILQKTDNVSILDNEILSRLKVIESQPMVFAILQHLVSSGFNEHNILMAFKIFKTDLCNNIPYGDRTYLEHLSIDLNRYLTVRDTLKNLDNKILIKKSRIEKLVIIKSNLEAFLLSLIIPIIYFYSTLLLNAQQIQIQKNLIKRILIISLFSYLLPILLFFCIIIKEAEKSVKSTFTIKQNNKHNNKKCRKKKMVVKERKKKLQKRTKMKVRKKK
jgi:hypothetical protein